MTVQVNLSSLYHSKLCISLGKTWSGEREHCRSERNFHPSGNVELSLATGSPPECPDTFQH